MYRRQMESATPEFSVASPILCQTKHSRSAIVTKYGMQFSLIRNGWRLGWPKASIKCSHLLQNTHTRQVNGQRNWQANNWNKPAKKETLLALGGEQTKTHSGQPDVPRSTNLSVMSKLALNPRCWTPAVAEAMSDTEKGLTNGSLRPLFVTNSMYMLSPVE